VGLRDHHAVCLYVPFQRPNQWTDFQESWCEHHAI